MKRRIPLVLLGLLLVMQVFRPDLSTPEEDPTKTVEAVLSPPPEVAEILERACRDCHTYRVDWPWYAQVAPASWMLAHHVEDGLEHLDLSAWGDLSDYRAAKKLDEIAEYVENGEMPLPKYLWLHPEARLTDAERALLAAWALSEHADLLDRLEDTGK